MAIKLNSMTTEQAKILGFLLVKVAGLVADALSEFAESGERNNQTSIALPLTNSEKRLLNRKEIAERLGVSVRNVSELIKKDNLPTVPLGKRRVQFNWEEVLNWTKERPIEKRAKTKLRVVS